MEAPVRRLPPAHVDPLSVCCGERVRPFSEGDLGIVSVRMLHRRQECT